MHAYIVSRTVSRIQPSGGPAGRGTDRTVLSKTAMVGQSCALLTRTRMAWSLTHHSKVRSLRIHSPQRSYHTDTAFQHSQNVPAEQTGCVSSLAISAVSIIEKFIFENHSSLLAGYSFASSVRARIQERLPAQRRRRSLVRLGQLRLRTGGTGLPTHERAHRSVANGKWHAQHTDLSNIMYSGRGVGICMESEHNGLTSIRYVY